ncbi:MAG: hypothetical protein CME59_13445 [Halioglobus sp.]|nr:hypothetical protein [Halioglobus sp.]
MLTLLLLPIPATADSELPTGVDPRPSGPDLEQLIAVLRTAPENGWVRVNSNQFQDVWTPTGLLVSSTKAPDSQPWKPHGIMSAFSGFSWDSRRGDLILYGGGHAAYGGNDVYRWRGTTLEWERMSLPSDIASLGAYPWLTVDGPGSSPQALHTYDGSLYLPIADRYVTFGGASFPSGQPYIMPDPNGSLVMPDGNTYRSTGPYFLDPARGDGDKVGGVTGSHSQWDNPNLWVIGGEMWENRDIPGNLPGAKYPRHVLENASGYTQENGKDVVYFFGQQSLLSKYTVNDVDDPSQDEWEEVGSGVIWGQGAAAYLPTHDLLVKISKDLFTYWDLSTPGPNNLNVPFVPDGEFSFTEYGFYPYGLGNFGMDYDAPRNRFLLWGGGGDVWALTPPAVVSPNGWEIGKIESTSAQNPDTANFPAGGVLGKWKYIAQLDAFMALQNKHAGNVWIYKPENWVEPTGDDPHIVIAEPVSKGYTLPNEDIAVTAVTSNPQSNIVEVELLLDGQTLAVITEPPYTTTLASVAPGFYTFEAIATDSDGQRFISPRVVATVANHVNEPPSVSVNSPLDSASIEFFEGRIVTLGADASDTDGHIAQVEFFVNGNSVGVAQIPPFTVDWEAQEGSYTLSAVATDNTNMTATSTTSQFHVTAPGGGSLLVLQDGLDGYSGTSDTYLDGNQTSYPKGAAGVLNSVANQYNPLVRFSIFSSEGGPVPDGANITYAALALYKSSYYDYSYRAHPLLVDWAEDQATWFEAAAGTPWHAAGAAGIGSDYAEDGSPAAPTGWEPEWVVLDVTDSVRAMSLGERSNYGWQLLGNGINYHKFFHASEYAADPTRRPKLILEIDDNRPSVMLTAPNEGASYVTGEAISLSADASDPDGSVTQVEFFYSDISLGVDTSEPYTLNWDDAPAGVHTLTAVATDDSSTSATSAAVSIRVLPPGC